ncbi:MAG TPA: hypothetical protein VIQ31_18845 [Phormidium sp.]
MVERIVNVTDKEVELPRLQVSSVDLAEDEIDWIRAICNLSGISIRAQVTQILQGHLIRFKPHYKRKISYVARKYGLTFEEAFARLQEGSPPFGDVVEIAPVIEAEESSNFGCEVKETQKDSKNDRSDVTESDEIDSEYNAKSSNKGADS